MKFERLKQLLLEKDHRSKIVNKVGLSTDVADYLHNLDNKYSIWIANQLSKDITIEEIKRDYLNNFIDILKFIKETGNINLNKHNINSIKELMNKGVYKEKEGITKVYEDSEWIIEIPETYDASCSNYGNKTSWCTASKDYGSSHYNKYKKDGELYVITNKKDPNHPYQLFIDDNGENTEFMNNRNNPVEEGIYNFLNRNKGLFNYFRDNTKLDLTSKVLEIHGRRFKYSVVDGIYVFNNINLIDVGFEMLPDELRYLGDYIVKGDFNCSNNNLTTLKGCPIKVGGDFSCSYNILTTLKGCPKEVGGYFYCSRNEKQFTEEEVKQYCDVGGSLYI